MDTNTLITRRPRNNRGDLPGTLQDALQICMLPIIEQQLVIDCEQ